MTFQRTALLYLKCPYQAKVIKTFDTVRKIIGFIRHNSHIPPSAFQITQYLARGVESRRAHHASARMRARTAKKKIPDRRSVLRPPGHGAHEEQLVEVHLAVKDVAAGQAVLSLHVERRNHLAMQDDVSDIRRVFGQSVDAAVGEPLFHPLIPGGVLERI